MARNQRRHANAIPVAQFATWIVIAVFVCGAGLGYVWCKNQLYTTGAQIKNLEREVTELRSRNEVARSKIAQLSSTSKLQERYDSGFIKLTAITNDRIVLVPASRPPSGSNELRAVANENPRE